MGSTAAREDRSRPRLFWPLFTVLGLILVATVFFSAQLSSNAERDEAETRNSQVVQSITREQQVVLLSLGIQGIVERTQDSHLFGQEYLTIPWSERASFIQYEFTAKLGFDGGQVQIEQTGDSSYRISIPELEFIGHSDERFKVAAEDNGVLSWITPPIDPVEMVNEVLNDRAKTEYVEQHQDVLRSQAEAFYSGILRGIDPQITAEYVYR
ncbi:hypothetical protein M3D92_11850 [Micrococcus terreus]|uniref:hypothetical protein n=1 Tax=Micrococcus terreus TaxID=574650 RepID=UPI0021A5A189|nr:hypothetical protein [Micrococcus terreus]MCT2089975.1 hypothetical protein [Micrococcus terreus]